jgi:hypothetical protein
MGEFEYNQGKTAYKKLYERFKENAGLKKRPAQIIKNNGVYDGQWLEGNGQKVIQGRGRMVWPNGEIYEGWWKHGHRWGKGRNMYENGDVYEGEFYDGEK